jgi:hypothetical protein
MDPPRFALEVAIHHEGKDGLAPGSFCGVSTDLPKAFELAWKGFDCPLGQKILRDVGWKWGS